MTNEELPSVKDDLMKTRFTMLTVENMIDNEVYTTISIPFSIDAVTDPKKELPSLYKYLEERGYPKDQLKKPVRDKKDGSLLICSISTGRCWRFIFSTKETLR